VLEDFIKTSKKHQIYPWLAFFLTAAFIGGFAKASMAQTRILRIAAYNIESDITLTNVQATFTNIVRIPGSPAPGPPLPGLIAPVNASNNFAAGGALEGIGEEVENGNAQPLDILALEETTSNPITVTPIVNALNTFYGVAGMYTNSSYQATEEGGSPSSGNGPNAVVFNTRTVQLLAFKPVDPSGGSSKLGSGTGEYREVMRYEFAPAGVAPASSNEFYIYVSHYKASSGSSNEAKRLGEALIIRTNEAIDLPATARVLYVGDYNVDDSGEAAYQTILSNTAPNGIKQGQGIDPLNVANNQNIDWSDYTTDPSILVMLTEHSYELEYRDDLQVMTTNVYGDMAGGLQYIPGTYHAFANNGLPYYGSVNSGSDTALNKRLVTNGPVFISAAQIYVDLTGASDHLPIVADYTIPMPTPLITGVSVAVTNLVLTATNGITNAVYSVLMSTNLLLPLTNWTMLANYTATSGVFTFTATNAVNQSAPQRFYLLSGK
jgi:hypothetical protein